MQYREATLADIPQMQRVRNAVKENVLSHPSMVRDEHYVEYLELRGKGWVCEFNSGIVGFAIADIIDHNVWALFVDPGYEHQGIGKTLHGLMLDWYFSQTAVPLWLGTAPASRAEVFYRRAGWKETGRHGKNEIKFEMHAQDWKKQKTLSL